MADKWANYPPQLELPSGELYAVTPSDSNNETTAFRSLYIGSAGDVAVVDLSGTAITFAGVPAETVLPVRGLRVNSTSTTASSIVGLV